MEISPRLVQTMCGRITAREKKQQKEKSKKKWKKCENQPYGNPNLCIRFMSMELNPICCASSIRCEEKSRKGSDTSETFTETVSKKISGTWKSFPASLDDFRDAIKTKIIGKFPPSSLWNGTKFSFHSSKHFTSARPVRYHFFASLWLIYFSFCTLNRPEGKSFFSATNRNRKINSEVAHAG